MFDSTGFCLILLLFVLVRFYFYWCYKFWERKNVATIEPRIPLGNSLSIFPTGFSPGNATSDFYVEFKKRGHKFGGVYFFTEPHLVLVDPDYISDFLATDFRHFANRGFYHNKETDPLSANLFAIDEDYWREVRTKLTSVFSTAKIKTMFPLTIDCAKNIPKAFDNFQNQDIDIKEIMSRFTTDNISSWAFGIQSNSLLDPDAEFRRWGQEMFNFNWRELMNNFLILSFPKWAHKLGIPTTKKSIEVSFMRAIAQVVNHRKDPKNHRQDFMQLLINLKDRGNLTMNELSAQAFIFYAAGFETSATTMSFALYEIARNPEIQEKLRQEILEVSQKYHDEITYEALNEMKYLAQVVDETLRRYVPAGTLTRHCTKEYTIKNTNIVLEKGTKVLIPTYGLHMDPEFYPEPEKFDPDRFSDEEKKSRHPFAYLPFGNGPRNCIGLRFGLMQSKMGVATVIKNYKLTLSPNCKPVVLDRLSFIIANINKIWLRAEKI